MWTLQDAKNRFSAVVEAALAGHPQKVSRRGKPAVVVLSLADYTRMMQAAGAHRGRFADHLLSLPQGPVADLSGAEVAPRDIDFQHVDS